MVASLYTSLASAKLRAQAGSARLFALRSAGDVLIVIAETMAPVVLAARFGTIAGWSAAEVALLVGIGRSGEGLATLVGRGVDPVIFGEMVRRGRFDQVLTRPVSPLGWLLTSEIEPRHAFRTLGGVGVIVWAMSQVHTDVSTTDVALLVTACLACAILVLSILVMGAALTFRTVEGSDVANLASNGGLGLTSYPLDMYGRGLRFAFTFLLPIGLCVYVPVLAVLDRDGPGILGPGLLALLPVVLAAFVALAALSWHAGLRRYQSTGS